MDKLQALYNLYLENGIITEKTSFDKFSSASDEVQNSLYNLGKEGGLFQTTELSTFKTAWGGEVKKKDDSEPVGDTEVITESTTEQVPAEDGSSASQPIGPSEFDPSKFVAPEQPLVQDSYPRDTRTKVDFKVEETQPIGPSEFDPEKFVAPEQPLVKDAYPGLFEAESDLVDRVGDKLARKYDRLGEDVEEFMPEMYADALDEVREDKKFISSYDALPEELKAKIEPGVIRENGKIVGLDQSLIPTESVKEIIKQYDKDEFEDTEGVIENLAGAIESQRKEEYFVKYKKAGQLQEDILKNQARIDELRKQGNNLLADQLIIPVNETIGEYNKLATEINDDKIIINSLDIISENEDMFSLESVASTFAGSFLGYVASAPKNILATLAHVANKTGYSPGLAPIPSNVYEDISESAMQDALKIQESVKENFGQDYRDKKSNFVGETLGQIGFVVASTALGGTPAALAAGYTMSTGEMYGEAINSGLSHNDAMNLSVAYGAISAPLEMLPLKNAFKKVGAGNVRKKIIQEIIKKGGKNFTKEFAEETVKLSLKPILKETLKEGAEEGLQEGAQYLLSKGLAETYNALKDEDKPEFLKAKFGSDEFIEELGENILLGSVAGSIGSVSLNLAGGNVFVGSDYKAMEKMFTDPNQMVKIDQQLNSYRKTGQIKTDEELQSAKEQVGIVAQAASEVQNATKNSKISIGLKKQLFKLTSEKISLEKAIEGVKTTSLVSDKKQTIQDLDQRISDIVSGKITEKDIKAEQELAPEVAVEEDVELTEELKQEVKDIASFFADSGKKISENLAVNKEEKIELSSVSQEIVNQATKAAVAIKRVAPNVKVLLHDTTKEYTDFAKEGTRGSYNPATKTIHIDLSKANKRTVGHETFHSILLESIKSDVELQKMTDDMYRTVNRSLATNPFLKRKLTKFSEKYDDNIRSEEALSELFGMLSSDYKKLSAPVKVKIKQFVNKVATKFGLGDIIKLSEQDLSDIETIDLLNTMAARVKEGEAITEEDVDILKSEPYTEGIDIEVNPDAPMNPEPRQQKDIYDDVAFAEKLPIVSMREFIKKVGGKIFAVTSDATKIGYDSKGDRIDGGFGYLAIADNVKNKIGFASLDVKVASATLGRIAKRYNVGDKVGVIIMVQNPSATVGNYYGGKYLGRGLLTLKNQSPDTYNEITDGFVELLNNKSIAKEMAKESANKNKLIELISNPENYTENEFASEWIADTTFEARRKILESLFIYSNDVRTNKSTNPTKLKLKEVGFNTLNFLMEYGDVKLLGENNIKNNNGGFAVGGFEMIVPNDTKQAAIDANKRGFVHPQFNGKIPSNGNSFIFDGLYPVNENFLEFSTPETTIASKNKDVADALVRKTFKNEKFYQKQFLSGKKKVLKKDRGYSNLKDVYKIKFKKSNPELLIERAPNISANIARGMGFTPDIKTPISEKSDFTPAVREQKMEDAKTPGERITTTVKQILFKGMQPKTKGGKPFSVHKINKGSFAAIDKTLASDYKGDKPLKQFTIPKGTTVDVVKVEDTNQPVSEVRKQEEKLIDDSDAQVVKLITRDARGTVEEQYIIKDDSILESGVDVVEEAATEEITKSIKQKDERKEKIAEGNKLFNKKQLQDATKIANRISERTGIDYKDAERISKLDKERAKKISDAYEKAKSEPEKREVKESYSALIDETILQYEEILLDGYTVEVSNDEYSNSGEMIDDLIENKNMRIFSTESGFGAEGITDAARKSNPMLKKTKFKDKNGVPLLVNDVFRFVHDFFGHAKMGNGFGPLGEENAWNVHSRMYSPLARRAMTTETRGQNSWVNFSGINENAFKVRDEARALRKKAQSSDNKKDAIALLKEAERKINEVYDMMDFAEQKVALLPEEFTKTDDEITRAVREQRIGDEDIESVITEARNNNFTDEAIKYYLVNVKKQPATKVNELLKVNVNLLDRMPKSFGNIEGGAAKGVKLFEKVQKYHTKLNKNNNKRKPANRLNEQQIVDEVIKFLEKQPEYKKEGFPKKKEISTQQAAMLSDIQKSVRMRPTAEMAEKIREARMVLAQRKKGIADIKKVQSAVRNFMRKALPKKLYTKSETLKLINKINDATVKNIDAVIAEVEKFVIEQNIKDLNAKVSNLLDISRYTKTQAGKKVAKKIDSETLERVKYINENILSNKATAEQIDASNAELNREFNDISAKTDLTVADVQRMSDISIITGYNNSLQMDNQDATKVTQLDSVIAQLEGVIEYGSSQLAERIAEQKRETDRIFEVGYKAVTGTDIDLSAENANQVLRDKDFEFEYQKERKRLGNKLSRKLSEIGTSIKEGMFGTAEALDGLMDKINILPAELFGGELQEEFTNKIDEATRTFKERRMMAETTIKDKLVELYGKKWVNESRKNRNTINTGIYINEAAKKKDMPIMLSQNQMAYYYNQYKDPANRASFANTFGTEYERVMEEMTNKLDPKVKQLADWQVDEFYPSLYKYYNDAYKKIYNADMPWNQFYAGILYRKGETIEPLDLLADKTIYNTAVGANSTKSRVQNNNKIEGMDMVDVMATYINQMEYFAAYSQPIREMNTFFKNKYIRNAIETIHNKQTMKFIDAMIEKIANKGGKQEFGDEFVNALNSTFVTSRIGLSPVVMIKQLLSIPTYSNDIGIRNWTKYSAKNATQLAKTWKEVRDNSVYMQDRRNDSILKTIETYKDSDMVEFVPSQTKKWLVDFLMYTTKLGDRTAIMLGGMPNYLYYKDQELKKGKTEQQAIGIAIRKFERDTKRTQQSADLQDKDYFQTKGAITRALNMFLTTPKQYLRKEIQAVRNLGRMMSKSDKAGKGTAWQNLRTFVMYHVFLPVLFQYVTLGLPGILREWRDDEDDKDLMRAAALGNLNALFLYGEIFAAAGDLLTGKPWAGEQTRTVGLIQSSMNVIKKLKKAITLKDEDKKEKAQKDAILELVNMTGAPASTIDKMIQNYKEIGTDDDLGKDIMRLLNYSKYQIEGPKKKKKRFAGPSTTSMTDLKKYAPSLYDEIKAIDKELKVDID